MIWKPGSTPTVPALPPCCRAWSSTGFIAREVVAKDARLKSLVPTEKGRQCAAAIHQCISDFEHDLQNGVSAQELEAIQGTLHKLIENAKAIRGKN